MAAWGTTTDPVPLLHGLGAIAGEELPVHPDINLVRSRDAGDALATTLGSNQAALLLANGGLAVGADLLEAATRLWFVEERARVALSAPEPKPPAGDWEQRLTHTTAELTRAKAWFLARFG